ncbi:hypothetical protein AUK40_05535 [Candidatus Wirthbacteria bacterium CG2_30_54_11]|uniref:Cytochrome b5 heme-binding domain-containing protein n=1 Tax=Candidatus Wirthbacteria bacterium CG2_30_54_11 TaxID=1817892 RepID=A0A1J5IXG1_9BACT|nr:MAG: hypothetical protein AUK40_05535 [Candidatus Wirthbacteria bacterium CG2_30_54_11]
MNKILKALAILSLVSFFILFMGLAVATRGGSSTNGSQGSTSAGSTCIVTVNGYSYDVTKLQNTHSGGNVFVCGTDNTSIFVSQHGTDYKLITKYKLP